MISVLVVFFFLYNEHRWLALLPQYALYWSFYPCRPGIFYLCVKCLIVILILLTSPCSDCSLIVSLLTNQIAEIIWFLSPGWRTLSMTPAMVSATTETLATVQWVVALVSGVQTESRTKMTVQEINMTWVTPFKMGIVIYPRRCPV